MERGPSEKGRASILGLILFGSLDLIIGRSLVSPRSLHQILWRRIEKDARNLLKEVDETRDKIADQRVAR
jgi:hypothetical protein